MADRMLRRSQVAALLGIGVTTVATMEQLGELDSQRYGGAVRIPESSVSKLLTKSAPADLGNDQEADR